MSDEISFGDLVELLGTAACDLLRLARGGRSIYIPHHPGPHSPLVVIVGQGDADRAAAKHGGHTVNVPILRAKRLEILRLRRVEHWPISRIAAQMRCTERTVYSVLAANPVDGAAANDQLALFDAG